MNITTSYFSSLWNNVTQSLPSLNTTAAAERLSAIREAVAERLPQVNTTAATESLEALRNATLEYIPTANGTAQAASGFFNSLVGIGTATLLGIGTGTTTLLSTIATVAMYILGGAAAVVITGILIWRCIPSRPTTVNVNHRFGEPLQVELKKATD